MSLHIENEFFTARVLTRGAELCSLRRKADGAELIWQGDERYWGAHAPLLFPVTGKLKDLRFERDGKAYELPPHGFAKEREFEVLGHTRDSASLVLRSDEETLQQYPFPFCLTCTFTLTYTGIAVTRSVKKTGGAEMLFSIGEHLGLSLTPWAESLEACELVFPAPQTASNWRLDKGLLDVREPYLDGARTLPLSKELFRARGCLVLQGLDAPWTALRARGAQKGARVSIGGFSALVVWSPDNEGQFVCVEPWQGLPSEARGGYDLARRPCIRRLPAGEEYAYTITVEAE